MQLSMHGVTEINGGKEKYQMLHEEMEVLFREES